MNTSLRILWLGTKNPWPAVDGGRLVVANTLAGLSRAGHRVVGVFPRRGEANPPELAGFSCYTLEVAERSALGSALRAVVERRPWTLVRHDLPAMAAAVSSLIQQEPFDLVHVEQIQAFAASAPARLQGLPVVLRAQNVEAELWEGLARRPSRFPFQSAFLRWESQRLARAEAAIFAQADGAVGLTARDCDRLAATSHRPVTWLRAPATPELPAGAALPGDPALVLLGGGWLPNQDGARQFCREIWPTLAADRPGARLHVFGLPGEVGEGLIHHPAPEDSREAFAAGAILVVPLQIASGVRMKILEAWARGVAVIASPIAVRGLDCQVGHPVEVADDVPSYAAALTRLADDAERKRRIALGRAFLREHHDPDHIAARLVEVYRATLAAKNQPPSGGNPRSRVPSDRL